MSRDWGVLQNLAENGVIRIASRIELRDERNHFLGWQDGTCGEHRTVGDHRAWCYDCGEWCYPGEGGGCSGCLPDLDDFSAAASPGVVKELIEENEKLRAEKPKCSCTPMPSGDGPEEDCEEHGRSYDWWVGLANKACEDRAEATTQALRWEERADKLDRSLTAALAVIKTALTELRASHYSRPFTVRSDYCRETGMFRQCESQGDPACSEACFTDTTICNGCGTQDECKYSNVIAALAAAVVPTTETSE